MWREIQSRSASSCYLVDTECLYSTVIDQGCISVTILIVAWCDTGVLKSKQERGGKERDREREGE